MGTVKRLRIFAGPNGSGKSTFINKVKAEPPGSGFKLGYYVNADDLESEFKTNGHFDFGPYGIIVNEEDIIDYFKHSTFSPVRTNDPELWKKLNIIGNKLFLHGKQEINSYITADLAEFIRQSLVKLSYSFSYETVMSDKNKISFLEKAKQEGYKIYLYYFATEDPLININRVKIRVAQNGHDVSSEVITKRYYKSLENLKAAVKLSDRAYIFDNSKVAVLIAEVSLGRKVTLIDENNVPNWFENYLM